MPILSSTLPPGAPCALDEPTQREVTRLCARTALLLQAEALGIPCAGGLYMLVAQAKRSCEVFTGTTIEDGEILRIYRRMRQEMENIVLIGMPGSGTIDSSLASMRWRLSLISVMYA